MSGLEARNGPRHVRIWPRQTMKTSEWQEAHTHTYIRTTIGP